MDGGRDSWAFPGADGQPHPARWFSRKVIRWQQYYSRPLDNLVKDANRVGDEGLYGLATAFEPGFSTGDFYKDIPYPTTILPYLLTGFVWREMTWDPALSRDQMLARVHKRFFGREAGPALAGDLWSLREILRTSAAGKLSRADREKLAPIEEHIAAARSTAGPKTVETLDLMSRAIRDIRQVTKSSAK